MNPLKESIWDSQESDMKSRRERKTCVCMLCKNGGI